MPKGRGSGKMRNLFVPNRCRVVDIPNQSSQAASQHDADPWPCWPQLSDVFGGVVDLEVSQFFLVGGSVGLWVGRSVGLWVCGCAI